MAPERRTSGSKGADSNVRPKHHNRYSPVAASRAESENHIHTSRVPDKTQKVRDDYGGSAARSPVRQKSIKINIEAVRQLAKKKKSEGGVRF
jgi:hypothetical protein